MGVPYSWNDTMVNGLPTLMASNGVPVVRGFRTYILTHTWDQGNIPLGTEQAVSLLEASNPGLGGGTQQVFRWAMLGWVQSRNEVIFEWLGQELATVRGQLAAVYPAYQQSKQQVTDLQAQVAALEAQLQAQQTGLVSAAAVKDRLSAIGLASSGIADGNTAIQQLITQQL